MTDWSTESLEEAAARGKPQIAPTARHGVGRSARGHEPIHGGGLHGGRPVQRPGRSCSAADARCGSRNPGVAVGTVDKFQGREAAVVFFTMTTSSSGHMPRGPEFLFSRNRLNVAVSRARCLAYLVCTEDLLNSRARTIEEMRLISTLCSFVEYSTA